MSQCDDILRHLQESGPITGAEAYRLYGCMRLPARVADLERRGCRIGRRTVKVSCRGGRTARVAQYYMEGNEE